MSEKECLYGRQYAIIKKMSSPENELKRIWPVVNRLCNFFLFAKKIEIRGKKNFVEKGPNIIVGNHIGTFKDVAIILKIVPRPIFFTANKMIFSEDEFDVLIKKHLQRHLNTFGYFLDLVLGPFKTRFIHFISSNIAKVGTIPVDLTGRKSLAIEKCQEYVENGRAIIALQGKGRMNKRNRNPYVSTFRKGPSLISYNLFTEKDISVAITPVAFFGTHHPAITPGKIKVNVGEPMFISDYMAGGSNTAVERFRAAMECRVHELFMQLIWT
jgi:1-acyl-sn-glycerol-3-phosphate acyltransferase